MERHPQSIPITAGPFDHRGEFRPIWLFIPAVLLNLFVKNLTPPVIDAYWDSIYYKSLAWGLSEFSTFSLKNHEVVPPLYPMAITPALWADGFLWKEFLIACLNPVFYFAGLFPLYRLSRRFLDPWPAAGVCLIYLTYPAAIFSQWTMSENLAAPLVLWAAHLFCGELRLTWHSRQNAVWLGLVLAALILTRQQFLVTAGVSVLWIAFRLWRWKKALWNPFYTALTTIAVTALVMWGLGYFAIGYEKLFYVHDSFEQNAGLWMLLSNTVNRLVAHLSALSFEGGLILIPIALMQAVWAVGMKRETDAGRREAVLGLVVQAAALLLLIALFRAFRSDIEAWHVSLRHVFYAGLLLIPLSVWGMGEGPGLTAYDNRKRWGIYFLAVSLCMTGFFFPQVWSGLANYKSFYTNSPSLDVFAQIAGEGVWVGTLGLTLTALIFGILALWKRWIGVLVICAFTAYLQAGSLDYLIEKRQGVIANQHIDDLHVFCAQLDRGRWHNLPIFVDDPQRWKTYLFPNLIYWINQRSSPFSAEKAEYPCLYLTFTEFEQGTLVFQSDALKVYRLEAGE